MDSLKIILPIYTDCAFLALREELNEEDIERLTAFAENRDREIYVDDFYFFILPRGASVKNSKPDFKSLLCYPEIPGKIYRDHQQLEIKIGDEVLCNYILPSDVDKSEVKNMKIYKEIKKLRDSLNLEEIVISMTYIPGDIDYLRDESMMKYLDHESPLIYPIALYYEMTPFSDNTEDLLQRCYNWNLNEKYSKGNEKQVYRKAVEDLIGKIPDQEDRDLYMILTNEVYKRYYEEYQGNCKLM